MEDTYGNTYQVALKNIPEILRSSLTLNRTATFEWSVLKLIRSNYSFCKGSVLWKFIKFNPIRRVLTLYDISIWLKKKTFHYDYDISLQISPI